MGCQEPALPYCSTNPVSYFFYTFHDVVGVMLQAGSTIQSVPLVTQKVIRHFGQLHSPFLSTSHGIFPTFPLNQYCKVRKHEKLGIPATSAKHFVLAFLFTLYWLLRDWFKLRQLPTWNGVTNVYLQVGTGPQKLFQIRLIGKRIIVFSCFKIIWQPDPPKLTMWPVTPRKAAVGLCMM